MLEVIPEDMHSHSGVLCTNKGEMMSPEIQLLSPVKIRM